MVVFIKLYKVDLSSISFPGSSTRPTPLWSGGRDKEEPWDEVGSNYLFLDNVIIQIKATEQYLPVVLFMGIYYAA